MTMQAPDPAPPGRSCPLHYRHAPEAMNCAAAPELADLEVLYVVGGLYGNEAALARVLEMFDAEQGRKALVFNGDFHWFDADAAAFARIQRAVLAHTALRGNVETELADATAEAEAGCGCAYPGWVGDAVVERSNRIFERLRRVVSPGQQQALAALPATLRADVGGLRLGIVHGDAQSLAGWGFAQEHLLEAHHREVARGWFERANVDAYACSHTCLPVFQGLRPAGAGTLRWILNNGAAGMPNFRGTSAGLLTRVGIEPCRSAAPRYGVRAGPAGIHLDALAIDFDASAWQAVFDRNWPVGSDAQASYGERIRHGPPCEPAHALRVEA